MSQIKAVGDTGGEVALGTPDTAKKRNALRQIAGNGRRQRASGAVGIGIVDTRFMQPVRLPVSIQQIVRTVHQMAAFDQNTASSASRDFLRGLLHLLFCADRAAADRSSFMQIRRHERA